MKAYLYGCFSQKARGKDVFYPFGYIGTEKDNKKQALKKEPV